MVPVCDSCHPRAGWPNNLRFARLAKGGHNNYIVCANGLSATPHGKGTSLLVPLAFASTTASAAEGQLRSESNPPQG